MRAGKLRHRLTIESNAATADTFGEMVPVWSTAATVWASIDALSGREYESAQEVKAGISHQVRCRYNTNISTVARFTTGARVLDINYIRDVEERNAEMICLCTEVV